MNGGQRMLSGWRSAEMKSTQYCQKERFHPAVLLYHFAMKMVVLWVGKLINLLTDSASLLLGVIQQPHPAPLFPARSLTL